MPQPPTDIISERTYQADHGYEMTRLHRIYGNDAASRVRVIVHQGISPGYAYAEASLWTANGWTQIVRLNGYEMDVGPSYVCWSWTTDTHPNAVATNDDCMAWLITWADHAYELAQQVIA